MNVDTIIFVSEMLNPNKNATSTQIMTKNLIEGFQKISNKLYFVAIVSDNKDYDDIKEYYSHYCTEVICVPDITKHRDKRVLGFLNMSVRCLINKKIVLRQEIKDILLEECVLVSHSPSIDAALICNEIKRQNSNIYYIQYWGDPLTLSLITPEEYTMKRCIFKMIEKKLHELPDKICYGTESLYQAQCKLLPEESKKSIFSNVSFCDEELMENEHEFCLSSVEYSYFGNYYSEIRDILPLYQAFSEFKYGKLIICGSGNVELYNKPNINILNRIPQSKAIEKENKSDIIICIMNKVGIQIPGKIFYRMNTRKPIIIIMDGPCKDDIKHELDKAHRFIFCDNNVSSIYNALAKGYSDLKKNYEYNVDDYSPESVCKSIIEKVPK